VRNLVTRPDVTVRVGVTTYRATARVVTPDTAEDARARTLVFAKYSPRHADLEGWRERALPVAIDVHGPAGGGPRQS
jgi:hypothetical protein